MIDSFYQQIEKLNQIIWGSSNVKLEIFERWCQGFSFSSNESTALMQMSGGPCAIIATAQAYIICEILFIRKQNLTDVLDMLDILLSALLNILVGVSKHSGTDQLIWVYWSDDGQILSESLASVDCLQSNADCELSPNKLADESFTLFINGLRCYEAYSLDELHAVALSLSSQLDSKYGILCFLYSILFTHGLNSLKSEMGDDLDPLIDPIHGHASQCLINLLITGQSTPYLFDGDRDIGGYTMKGIGVQPKVGFLTYMEALRYCEVGWFLKNPYYPVWILGSETHLTVLGSSELSLVVQNDKDESSTSQNSKANLREAELEFDHLSMDPDSGGFIGSDLLNIILDKLRININPMTIQELLGKLDPENLGIILKKDFLLYFFSDELKRQSNEQRNFQLLHYNGLEHSNTRGKVCFQFGDARLIDPTDELVETELVDESPIQKCLATKWPTIRIKWRSEKSPSLN